MEKEIIEYCEKYRGTKDMKVFEKAKQMLKMIYMRPIEYQRMIDQITDILGL